MRCPRCCQPLPVDFRDLGCTYCGLEWHEVDDLMRMDEDGDEDRRLDLQAKIKAQRFMY